MWMSRQRKQQIQGLVWSRNREEAIMAGAKRVMGRVVADENGEEAIRSQVIWGLVGHNRSFSFNSKWDERHRSVLDRELLSPHFCFKRTIPSALGKQTLGGQGQKRGDQGGDNAVTQVEVDYGSDQTGAEERLDSRYILKMEQLIDSLRADLRSQHL